MRAIGFRAFVKRKKKMLPVTDLCFNETEAVGVSGCGNAKCTLCVDWYSFDDVVLMQYTGLKDKNGKKILKVTYAGRNTMSATALLNLKKVSSYMCGKTSQRTCGKLLLVLRFTVIYTKIRNCWRHE